MIDLPKTGWLTHCEQTEPGVGDHWHMLTTLLAGFEVCSFETSCAPERIKLRLGDRLPKYVTVLARVNHLLHFEPADTPERARENHYEAVRGVIHGTHVVLGSEIFGPQLPGRA